MGTQIVTASLPKELFRRRLLAPPMIAMSSSAGVATMGLPFYRLEEKFAYEGVPIDRDDVLVC